MKMYRQFHFTPSFCHFSLNLSEYFSFCAYIQDARQSHPRSETSYSGKCFALKTMRNRILHARVSTSQTGYSKTCIVRIRKQESTFPPEVGFLAGFTVHCTSLHASVESDSSLHGACVRPSVLLVYK